MEHRLPQNSGVADFESIPTLGVPTNATQQW
jgi:hypothetical protein